MPERMSVKMYLARKPRPTRTKWGNIKTTYNGRTFDSRKEANYAMYLEASKKAKDPAQRVVSYRCQVPYAVSINGIHICKYFADFVVIYADGREEVIDTKPLDRKTGKFRSTDVFKLKRKMVEAQYGIRIIEA